MINFLKKFKNSQSGQSLVELIIAIGLASLLLPAILTGISASRGGRAQQEQRIDATSYLKQTQEAIRSIASADWNNISTNGTYHPVISGTQWSLASGTQTVEDFTISATISDVQRNSAGTIVSSGGTVDPSTKQVTILITWSQPFPSTISSVNYYTRYRNTSYLETTVAQFTPGATNSATRDIVISNTAGGEIVLGAGGGGGDWCAPTLTLTTLDLPKSGVANAVSAIEGKVAAGTGDNSSGVSFASVNISTTHPPDATIAATFDGYKTNAVFGESDYAYLATDTNSKEVVIISLTQYSNSPTNSKYLEVGSFNAPGNGSGNSVVTSGNYGYMTSGDRFYVFDLSSKSGSRSRVNTNDVILAGTGVKIVIVGNYAYVATSSISNQLQIIDISNPASPSVVGNRNVAGLGAKDISVNSAGTRAYLATGNSSTQREMFIINTSNKSAPSLVTGGTYDTSGMNPTGINVVTGNRVLIVGTGGVNQYQVVNINNEGSPASCGGLAVSTGINGVSSVLQSNGYAYSYIITGDASSELKVILGGAGAGSGYNTSGVFESFTFDPGSEVTWNNLSVTSSVPEGTTLRFKVALKDGLSNSCAGVVFGNSDFFGPDGQTGTFFPETGGVIPFDISSTVYKNPGRCARYRAYLNTTDITQSPVVYDASFNYSL